MTTPDEPAREKPDAAPSVQHTLLAASHEIRSAMHGLAGMLALLCESGLNTAQLDYAESASDSARALFDLIERITDLSLIESGALRATPAPFDLAQEMRAVCSEKAAAARERGSDLQIHYPPSTLLHGDVRWISNLLADLIDWAAALAPKGSASLRTELARKTTGSCRVQMTLEVQGAAVSMKPVAATRCASLADMMGGSAGIRPSEDGATIWCAVELPFACNAQQPDSGKTLPCPAVDGPQTQKSEEPALAGRRILVADDNPVNRKFAARLLEQLGCIVALAEDGRQAEQMHAQSGYDLILMDCDMPQLDGYEATRRIRRAEGERRHTPIVALTACASPSDRGNCIAAGMDDFIAKPAQKRELVRTLTRWLFQASPCAEDSSPEARDELEAVRDMFGKDFAELGLLYLTDSPARVAALRAAGTADDPAQTAKIAHAFSGSCASIGASALSRMCRELEVAAKSGALKEFRQKMTAIEAEYLRVSERLRALLQ